MTRGRPELCVGALVTRGADLLLIKRGREPGLGTWSVPGGRVERGETMAQAVIRELEEETGLRGRCGELVGWVERISDQYHFVIADYVVTALGTANDDGLLVAGDDAAEARFVSRDEVRDLPLATGLLEFLTEHGYVDSASATAPRFLFNHDSHEAPQQLPSRSDGR